MGDQKKIRVEFVYVPEPDERDDADSTGLTEAASLALCDQLSFIGAENIHVAKEARHDG